MNSGTLLHNLIVGAPELMIKMCFWWLYATYDVTENRIKISSMIHAIQSIVFFLQTNSSLE